MDSGPIELTTSADGVPGNQPPLETALIHFVASRGFLIRSALPFGQPDVTGHKFP
jgi:hypothetical protein